MNEGELYDWMAGNYCDWKLGVLAPQRLKQLVEKLGSDWYKNVDADFKENAKKEGLSVVDYIHKQAEKDLIYKMWKKEKESDLKDLHADYEKDTKSKMDFSQFCASMFKETIHAK